MKKRNYLTSLLAGSASALVLAHAALANGFNIPGGDLEAALNLYTAQTGIALTVSDAAIQGVHTRGARGVLSADEALSRILVDTGFTMRRHGDGVITIVPETHKVQMPQLAQAAPKPVAAAGI